MYRYTSSESREPPCTQGEYATTNPDRPAFIMASTRDAVTYRNFEARTNKLAHLLVNHGLEPLDHC
jgi:long-chain acyl-CoA synthetase